MTRRDADIRAVPADASPEEVERLLGPAPERAAPDADRRARSERFISAAAELLRINLLLELGGERWFWNAAHLLDGVFEREATEARMLSPEQARELRAAVVALLEEAEALRPEIEVAVELDAERAEAALYHSAGALPPGAARLQLETLAAGEWEGRDQLATTQVTGLERAVARLVESWARLPEQLGRQLTVQSFRVPRDPGEDAG